MSTAFTAVRVHSDKYKKDFEAVVTFLIQYIDKRVPILIMKVASVCQNRRAKWQKTSTSQLKKYSILTVQCQLLYELWKKAVLTKGKKTPESSRALEARVAVLKAKTDNSSDKSLFADDKSKANNKNNPALDRKGNGTRQSCTDT